MNKRFTKIITTTLAMFSFAMSSSLHADWEGDEFMVIWTLDGDEAQFSSSTSPATLPISYSGVELSASHQDGGGTLSYSPSTSIEIDFTGPTTFQITASGSGIEGPSVLDLALLDLDWLDVPGQIVGITETSFISRIPDSFVTRSLLYGSDLVGLGFDFINSSVLTNGRSFTATYEIEVEHEEVPIPEPGTYVLLGGMLLCVGLVSKKKKRGLSLGN